jgi:cation diffusion facilitator CzcD-associated flavoprotein CzcO
MTSNHFDVLIVGAGLSGIGAAYHLQANCPRKSYAIIEAREAIGGTWDLFRYPGIRSDSDMHTLGYSFKPWTQHKAIADGEAILEYVRSTAREHGIQQKIRFKQRVKGASWSSEAALWSLEVEHPETGELTHYSCNFLFMCSGYYDYAKGYTPELPGIEKFNGRIVHPQSWTNNIDYAGKRVVVIGSGATAVTLVPEMAKRAAHVTMLQRSPTYIVSRPEVDALASAFRRVLPSRLAYGLTRWKNVVLGMIFFQLCKRSPEFVKNLILKGVRTALGPDFDVATHFTPRYNPWDQRLCLVPNGDLFDALKAGSAAVVTDHIESLTERGIKLRSGQELDADLIVTATGLNLVVLGGAQIDVDGRRIDFSKTLTYKGMMYSGVPNLASAFGYTNASWTLKCDLTCTYVCRLLNYMDAHGYRQCTPHNRDPEVQEEPFIDFSSGYVQRAVSFLPKQGSKSPWKLYQNYLLDLLTLKFGKVKDGAMEFASKKVME